VFRRSDVSPVRGELPRRIGGGDGGGGGGGGGALRTTAVVRGTGAAALAFGAAGGSDFFTAGGLRPNSLARNLNILSPSVDFPSDPVAKASR